jgi:magnesium-transporting ATPase (P-type)
MKKAKNDFKYNDDKFVDRLEQGSTLVSIIGFKDPTCKNVDILINLIKKAGIQVIVCSGNSLENVLAFA